MTPVQAACCRRYLLLGQGDFAGRLLDLVGDVLNLPSKAVHMHEMRERLDMAIRQSNAQSALLEPRPGGADESSRRRWREIYGSLALVNGDDTTR